MGESQTLQNDRVFITTAVPRLVTTPNSTGSQCPTVIAMLILTKMSLPDYVLKAQHFFTASQLQELCGLALWTKWNMTLIWFLLHFINTMKFIEFHFGRDHRWALWTNVESKYGRWDIIFWHCDQVSQSFWTKLIWVLQKVKSNARNRCIEIWALRLICHCDYVSSVLWTRSMLWVLHECGSSWINRESKYGHCDVFGVVIRSLSFVKKVDLLWVRHEVGSSGQDSVEMWALRRIWRCDQVSDLTNLFLLFKQMQTWMNLYVLLIMKCFTHATMPFFCEPGEEGRANCTGQVD